MSAGTESTESSSERGARLAPDVFVELIAVVSLLGPYASQRLEGDRESPYLLRRAVRQTRSGVPVREAFVLSARASR